MSGPPKDGPFDVVVAKAEEAIRAGGTVFFKFTCVGCGVRQTFEEPNAAYVEGVCEECGAITDLRKVGCGFLLVMGLKPKEGA